MAKKFYARVSTAGQDLGRQLAVAREYADIADGDIYCDKQSGKNFDRTEYQRLKADVRPGDEVIIKELDRLGRNKDEVKREIEWFKEAGVTLRILDVPTTLIDFKGQDWIRDMVNNILIEVLGAIAEQERIKTLSRQREGIDAMPTVDGKKYSEKKGRFYGRARKDTADFEKYFKMTQTGEMSVNECCKAMGISRSCWYGRVREAG